MRTPAAHLLLVCPLVVLAVVFVPSALDAGWVLDDLRALSRHAHDGEPWGEWTNSTYGWSSGDGGHLWRPLPAFFQHLAALAAGRTPATFRLANVVLHAGVVLVAMSLVRRTGGSVGAAAFAGTVLVLHPAVAEVVPWSSDVFDVMLALVLLLAAARAQAPASPWRRAAETLLFTLAACLCKESAATAAPALAAVAWAAAGWRAGLGAGLGSGVGAGSFLLLHGAVTGQGYGRATGSPVWDMLLAGLDTLGGLPTLPARATAAHLFEPGAAAAAPLGVVVLCSASLVAWLLRADAPAQRRWLAAVVGMVVLSAPAAIGIPFIGVQASRYVFQPLVWLVALGAQPLAALAAGRQSAVLLVVGACLLWAPRTATRVGEFQDNLTLFSAERQSEPDNPYARASVARHLTVAAIDRAAGLSMWAEALDDLPAHIRVPDPRRERWDLAQAAFLAGAAPLALQQASRLRAEPGWFPEQLACLEADSLDALGRHEDAAGAARGCVPAARP